MEIEEALDNDAFILDDSSLLLELERGRRIERVSLDKARLRLTDLESLSAGQADCRAAEGRRANLWQVCPSKVELVHDLRRKDFLLRGSIEGYANRLL